MIEKHSNAKMQVWHRGFKFTLTNGYTLSCAFGHGNYCDNRHDHNADLFHKDCHKIESSDFEVAVFEPNGDMVDLVQAETDEDGVSWSDQVIGWVPASALPMLIMALKFWPVRGDFTDGETFKRSLHARCRIFRRICDEYKDKAAKEAANV